MIIQRLAHDNLWLAYATSCSNSVPHHLPTQPPTLFPCHLHLRCVHYLACHIFVRTTTSIFMDCHMSSYNPAMILVWTATCPLYSLFDLFGNNFRSWYLLHVESVWAHSSGKGNLSPRSSTWQPFHWILRHLNFKAFWILLDHLRKFDTSSMKCPTYPKI